MNYAYDFRELQVCQKSKSLSLQVFILSQRFPKSERYALTDQILRSSRSVGAQIAEAWSKRKYPKHFISKLTDASAEQQDTIHWIEIAKDCNYISAEKANNLISECDSIGKMINKMISKADQFCKSF